MTDKDKELLLQSFNNIQKERVELQYFDSVECSVGGVTITINKKDNGNETRTDGEISSI